jgi:integrase
MAEPFQRDGKWYGRVKNAAGLWRNVILAEARTKAQARELQAALALRSRRQRDGLEPMSTDRALTVGALLRWWLDTYVAGKTWAGREENRFRLYFESTDLIRLPVVALTAGRLELFLQHWSQKGLAPASVNKLRALVRTAFNRARRADLVHGQNPASDTKPRKVPKRAPAFLEPHEVPRLLAELTPEDRPLVATALYAGLRKGELFGLQKRDVDLKRRLLTVRRSYGNDTTKGAREEAVPIAAALAPYLEAALEAAKGSLLFPRPDGEMRTEADKLGKRIRTALTHAGIVEGYLHLCRRCKRNGSPHEEKHPDCERRRCPKCNMLLWAKALARKFRLHDTRHTTATLLLAAGVDLYAVARILRHSDPKVTFETYAHLVPGYLHEQIDRLPKLKNFAALVLRDPAKPEKQAGEHSQKAPENSALEVARLAGVEPAARGFEVVTPYRPCGSRSVPLLVSPWGYADAAGRGGTHRTGRDADLCHARATDFCGCIPTRQERRARRAKRVAGRSGAAASVPQSARSCRAPRRMPRDDLPAGRARRTRRRSRWQRLASLQRGPRGLPAPQAVGTKVG